MRCLACGAQMQLIDVAQDATMPVPGYERLTFSCSACGDIEQRLVFTRQVGLSHIKSESMHTAPPISPAPTTHKKRVAASDILRRVFAKLRGAYHTVGCRLVFSQGQAQRFTTLVSVGTTPGSLAPPTVSRSALELASVPKTLPTVLRRDEAPSVPTAPPTFLSSEIDLDVCEALLRRAIKMVRGPTLAPQTKTSASEIRSGAPSNLVRSTRAERPPESRIAVHINHDPQKAKYVARAATSGLYLLGHQDGARLQAMCERMGWRVVDGAAVSASE
jgi:hypothetical protein